MSNSQEWRQWKDRKLYELVNHFGDEEYELVSFSHHSKSDNNYLIFKCPKI
ncbi:hypothetical protein [Okeania sp.]|uniref:hypothetical protein n=1 Tax=Okeania sp. TaxID=3100323 RepID=UPI002B4ADC17|nr:hypothetical protein [Okeania sp.]MEB3342512.1 hypothetical protein [Okeania sp.]